MSGHRKCGIRSYLTSPVTYDSFHWSVTLTHVVNLHRKWQLICLALSMMIRNLYECVLCRAVVFKLFGVVTHFCVGILATFSQFGNHRCRGKRYGTISSQRLVKINAIVNCVVFFKYHWFLISYFWILERGRVHTYIHS